MTLPALSPDQAEAWDAIAEALAQTGIDLASEEVAPAKDGKGRVMAVIGKAGSGKTLLLAELTKALKAAGVDLVSGDYEGKKRKDRRTVAILAPTNKAAFVLRMRGVPATTIHRILYTPVYDPDYERIADWLTGAGDRPAVEGVIEGLTDAALDRAKAFYDQHASIPGALAAAGLRGSDFIRGWKRREDGLDIGLIDEASMLDEKQFDDLREIFPTLILFGDPAQLAPVGQSGEMVFDRLAAPQKLVLNRIHRQTTDSPILDLAHALADPALDFPAFERMVADAARRDERVVWAERVESDLAASLERGKIDGDLDEWAQRLTVSVDRADFARCDLVVEAVFEDMQVKIDALTDVEAHLREDAWLASNTSSLSIGEIATHLQRPERFCGLHYFNPVPASKLVEVVIGEQTGAELQALSTEWVRGLGKTPVVVKNAPGFASSRLGVAIALEAIRMVEEGVASPEDIDAAMVLGYKFPVGPLALTDIVGLDVRLGIAEYLESQLGERFAPPQLMRDMVARGELGRKSGKGFFDYR